MSYGFFFYLIEIAVYSTNLTTAKAVLVCDKKRMITKSLLELIS